MTASSTSELIVDSISSFGGEAFVVLTAIIGIGIGFLVFYWGWRHVKRIALDRSATVGGFYVRNVPYQGYNRFRSRKWNMANTMK